jgi:regulator of RNase E activity RraB
MSQPPWTPSFDFYIATLDGDPAAIALDMGAADHAPVPTHPRRLAVRITMKHPRPDGLRSREEFDALSAVEDRISEALGHELEAWMVGRVVYRGSTDVFFYAPKPQPDDEERLAECIERNCSDYEVVTKWSDDKPWKFYFEFLWPDRATMQTMANRRVVMQLEEAGDDPSAVRNIDHFAFFDDQKACGRAAAALHDRGFTVDAPQEREDGSWSLQFHREDALAGGRIDAVTTEILEVIGEDEGAYDGWGCPVVATN